MTTPRFAPGTFTPAPGPGRPLAMLVAQAGIELRLAATPSSVRETLVRAGFEQHCGPVVANQPVGETVAAPGAGGADGKRGAR